MGCGGTKEIAQPPNENLVQTDPNNLNYIETIVNEGKFLDFEETKSNIFLGVGVKKIHNYICSLPYDKLYELREQFWESRNKTDGNWEILRECIEICDDKECNDLLKENNLIVIDKCISRSYNENYPNFIYKIPNFCIQDFIVEKDFEIYEKMYDQIEDENINIKVFYNNDNNYYDFKIRNKSTGFDLKYKISKKLGIDTIKNEVRILFRGQEILDSHCLYFFNIGDGVINVLSVDKKFINYENRRIMKKQIKRTKQKRSKMFNDDFNYFEDSEKA